MWIGVSTLQQATSRDLRSNPVWMRPEGKPPYFEQILGSGPPWGQNSAGPSRPKSWIRCCVWWRDSHEPELWQTPELSLFICTYMRRSHFGINRLDLFKSVWQLTVGKFGYRQGKKCSFAVSFQHIHGNQGLMLRRLLVYLLELSLTHSLSQHAQLSSLVSGQTSPKNSTGKVHATQTPSQIGTSWNSLSRFWFLFGVSCLLRGTLTLGRAPGR